MTLSQAVKEMKQWSGPHAGDAEIAHGAADDILIDYLKANGAAELAVEWENVLPRWYA